MLFSAHSFPRQSVRVPNGCPSRQLASCASGGLRARGRTVAARAIKLYTNPGSRGKIPEWYLAELDLPFETVFLDMRRGDHKKPEYLKIHPFGKVPALVDEDGLSLFESGAILLHLANKYGKLDTGAMGKAAQWTLFANSTMCEAFFQQGNFDGILKPLEELLASGNEYLEGSTFSVSDIAVGSYLLYLPLFFPDRDLTKYPSVWAYMQRLAARPSCPEPYQQAMAAALEAAKSKGGLGGFFQKLGAK